MPLLLLFRKKARSARLFACKRAHGRLTVATTFLRVCLRQANVAIVRRIYTPNTVPLMPLLLLFRKKARLARLFACKRAHDGSQSLPPFCEYACGRQMLL